MTAATPDIYFGNMGVTTVAGGSGTPAVLTLAAVKDCEVTEEWEHAEAYGWGSVDRVGVAKYNHKVTVKIGWIKFAPKLGEWWPLYIKDASAGAGSSTDTNTVTLFTVTLQINPLTSGNTNLLLTVSNVYFPKFPIKATEGQWIKVDMEGVGTTSVASNP